MKNIKLTLGYDGTNYQGWQIQKNAITIQEILTKKLEFLLKQEIHLIAAGRTDAGVHARAQVVNFLAELNLPLERLPRVLNAMLPEDIVITHATEMPLDFHARYHTTSKTYRYTIDNGKFQDIFRARYTLHVPQKLNIYDMSQVSKIFVGHHDFSAFCAAHGSSKTFVRNVQAFLINKEKELITLEITADGFLYHMVRNIAGLCIKVGLGKLSVLESKKIMASCKRSNAPATAPAKGLCLWQVRY